MPPDMCTKYLKGVGTHWSERTSQKKLWQLPRHSAVILAEVHAAWEAAILLVTAQHLHKF